MISSVLSVSGMISGSAISTMHSDECCSQKMVQAGSGGAGSLATSLGAAAADVRAQTRVTSAVRRRPPGMTGVSLSVVDRRPRRVIRPHAIKRVRVGGQGLEAPHASERAREADLCGPEQLDLLDDLSEAESKDRFRSGVRRAQAS